VHRGAQRGQSERPGRTRSTRPLVQGILREVRDRPLAVLVGLVAAAVWFLSVTVLIPVRVTFGAGSVRCGTVLHPKTRSETGDVCPRISDKRLAEAWATTAIFAGVTAFSFLSGRFAMTRPGGGPEALAGVSVLVWLTTTALMLFWITGARSALGS
jgi:hypothetical protein